MALTSSMPGTGTPLMASFFSACVTASFLLPQPVRAAYANTAAMRAGIAIF